MTCPECDGKGYVGGPAQAVAGEPQTAFFDGEGCWVCDGEGEINQDQYDAWAAERARQFEEDLRLGQV